MMDTDVGNASVDAVSRALDQAVRAAFLLGMNWQGGTEAQGAARAVQQARGRVLPVLNTRIDQAVEEAQIARRLARHRADISKRRAA